MTPIAATAAPQSSPHLHASAGANAFADCLATADVSPAETSPATNTPGVAAASHSGARPIPDAAPADARKHEDAPASKTAPTARPEKKKTASADAPDAPAQTPADIAMALSGVVAWTQSTPPQPPAQTGHAADAELTTSVQAATPQAHEATRPPAQTAAPASPRASADDHAAATPTDTVSPLQPAAAAGLAASMAGNTVTPTPAQPTGSTVAHATTGGATLAVPQAGTAMVSLLQTPTAGPQVVLHLAPEALGAVTVTISRDDQGHTSVTFTASEPDTLHALATSQHDLHALIQDAGLPATDHKLHFELAAPQAVSAAAPTDAGNGTDFSSARSGFNDSFTPDDQNANTLAAGQGDAGTGAGMSDNAQGNAGHDSQRQARSGAATHRRGDGTILPAAATYRTIGVIRPVNITV